MDIVDSPAGAASTIRQTQINLAGVSEFLAIVPGLGSINLGMVAARTRNRLLLICEFFRWIEVKNALAGVAKHGLLAGANVIVSLRPKHDLARHALMIAHFGDAGAAEL